MTLAAPPPSSPAQLPIDSLANVGDTRAKAFHQLGVKTVGDLLQYFPRSYQHEYSERPIRDLAAGPVYSVRGTVCAVDYIPSRPRARFEATLDDGSAKLSLVWFNGAYLRRQIHPGLTLRLKGKVKFVRQFPQMVNPRWEIIDEQTPAVAESVFRAVYPATQKLPSPIIEQIVRENLEPLLNDIEEWYGPQLLARRGLMGRRDAHRAIHLPADERQAMAARRRIIYDELMLMQLGLGVSKRLRDGRLSAPAMRLDKLLDQRIRQRFPFILTDAQQKAVWQIARDLRAARPMHRLLQGDVGSGKTVVAVYAMLVGVANKLQSAILAPTEVLAEQHYLTLSNMLRDSKVSIELFTHRTKKQERSRRLKDLVDGKIHIAVGTQALIGKDVEFANLGLVVVDEQHRLGVLQRAVLKSKGLLPHYLVMTATPIPRTLALSYFADFDLTVLDELPPGRQPIKTRWLRVAQAGNAYDFVVDQVRAGRQAYVVFPQIDDDGLGESRSVLKEAKRLGEGPLAGLRLAVLHGQMSTDQKQEIMTRFRAGGVDVLIATTVIEVGIDVPNATVMVIDNAERFGLSQLHQLRGRVGRGTELSHCLLISDAVGPDAEARLLTMTRTTDGFKIAEKDLSLRGPGEFFGTRQHGLPEFKLADVTQEMALLAQARDDAQALLAEDARLVRPEHQYLRATLKDQLGDVLALAQVG